MKVVLLRAVTDASVVLDRAHSEVCVKQDTHSPCSSVSQFHHI